MKQTRKERDLNFQKNNNKTMGKKILTCKGKYKLKENLQYKALYKIYKILEWGN